MTTLMRSTSRAALVALALGATALAPVAAVAQSAEQSAEQPADPTLVPEETAPAEAPGTPSLMEDTQTTADGMGGMEADPTEGTLAEGEDMAEAEPAKPVEGQITLQDRDSILAGDLLGASVFNGEDQKVGDINDLIIALTGEVEGVVIGVGGFLGMGEKDVAVEMAMLDVVREDGANPRLVTSATKTDLESAPAFVTAKEQARQAEALRMQDGATDGAAVPVE